MNLEREREREREKDRERERERNDMFTATRISFFLNNS